jgi:UDP-GlcNAc:undecaprenyl-phosphate GlcNAc-1-phosphate transferase
MTRGAMWLPQDKPNQRSLHSTPVPRCGGAAVMLGFIVGSLLFFSGQIAILLLLAIALSAISFLDDWRGLSALVRLVVHVMSAAFFVYLFLSGTALPGLLLIGTAIVWMTNLYNFMDGSDGLAGGMTVSGFGFLGIAAYLGNDMALALAAWSIAAAALAFLAYNFHPARIFMGDAGSIPLGFLAAALGLLGWHRGLWPLWYPIAVFAPFVADASVTLARRVLRGERFWHAHRSHYYQRLVQMGWGHRRTALTEYALMLACGIASLLSLGQPLYFQAAVVIAIGIVLLCLALWIDARWRSAGKASLETH